MASLLPVTTGRFAVALALATAITRHADAQSPDRMPVRLQFRAVVGDAPFACGQQYADIGTSHATVTPTEFRMYIHDVALVTADGRTVPVALTQDGRWQLDNIALLDFEDGTGPCSNGTPDLRDVVEGSVPRGEYTGLRFAVGVPFERNHRDLTSQPSPLSLTRMFWAWNSGYKFLRLDMRVAARGAAADQPTSGWVVHLGSTNCTPTGSASTVPTTCEHPNRPGVTLTGLHADRDVVVVDVASLLATSDVAVNTPRTAAGCMSSQEDPECGPLFGSIGLPFGVDPAGVQRMFRVGTRTASGDRP